jgi:hypothetical protein
MWVTPLFNFLSYAKNRFSYIPEKNQRQPGFENITAGTHTYKYQIF